LIQIRLDLVSTPMVAVSTLRCGTKPELPSSFSPGRVYRLISPPATLIPQLGVCQTPNGLLAIATLSSFSKIMSQSSTRHYVVTGRVKCGVGLASQGKNKAVLKEPANPLARLLCSTTEGLLTRLIGKSPMSNYTNLREGFMRSVI